MAEGDSGTSGSANDAAANGPPDRGHVSTIFTTPVKEVKFRPRLYPWYKKLGDRFAGWFDGRRGQPVTHPDPQVAPHPTPRLRRIQHEYGEHITRARSAFEARIQLSLASLESAERHEEAARMELQWAEEVAEGIKSTGPNPHRRPGEHDLPDTMVTRRRSAEHRRSLARAREHVAHHTREHGKAQSLLTDTRSMPENLTDQLRAEVQRITHTYKVRIHSYLDAVADTHPDPEVLDAHFRSEIADSLIASDPIADPDGGNPAGTDESEEQQ